MNELKHHGIKGQKWGRRRFQTSSGSLTPAGLKRYGDAKLSSLKKHKIEREKNKAEYKNTPEYQAKIAKRNKAIKIGAVAAGTALAAYGTYKVSKMVYNKRSNTASKKAEAYVKDNFLHKIGETTFANGSVQTHYSTKTGSNVVSIDNVGTKAINRHNASVMGASNQIYKDAMNNRLNRNLSRIINVGDGMGEITRGAGKLAVNTGKKTARVAVNTGKKTARVAVNTGKKTGMIAKRATNSVLDKVNPIYENVPTGSPRTATTYTRGSDYTKKVSTVTQDYVKKKVKRR